MIERKKVVRRRDRGRREGRKKGRRRNKRAQGAGGGGIFLLPYRK
jgi:hypothetical protein